MHKERAEKASVAALHTALTPVEDRVLAGRARNEDAAVVTIPVGQAIVQTVDILTPIVNDPFHFGRIAAANALSDVYAMGGKPWCAMNIVCFPAACLGAAGEDVLLEILRGGVSALDEAGAALVGGHTVEDDEIKYGLAVTGIISPGHVATNDGLRPGDHLILTKPLGTGILATAVKARWEHWEESEAALQQWCGRLNKVSGEVIGTLGLRAATDITGFGLGGHALEMAHASGFAIELRTQDMPLLDHALEYARDGLIPAGSYANRKYWMSQVHVAKGVDKTLESIAFDAQTSGGMLLAVPEAQVAECLALLRHAGEEGWLVGLVRQREDAEAFLHLV